MIDRLLPPFSKMATLNQMQDGTYSYNDLVRMNQQLDYYIEERKKSEAQNNLKRGKR